MSIRKQVLILCIATLSTCVLGACGQTQEQTSAGGQNPAAASEKIEGASQVAQGQTTGHVLEGELTRVDVTNKTLSVKDAAGRETQLRYTDQTQIRGSEDNVEGLATKSGTSVTVHFDVASMTATQIEVRQRQQ